ncbi:hypothetical protein GCM10025787_53970 [Saccharopolyspora rosea]|uniref:Uncharacterized protein n=1 Tax=Saccharopolyspora rosea TaxID=524884 RepID=A0ABW3FVC3_9PSEU
MGESGSGSESDSGHDGPTLGLIADPDLPQEVAEYLAEAVPEDTPDEQQWSVEVVVDPVTAGRSSISEILRAAREQRQAHGWDCAICVTDLPVRAGSRPVLAEVDLDEHVGVISLPALGAAQPFRRAQQVVRQLLDDFARAPRADGGPDQRRHGLDSRLTELVAPIQRLSTAAEPGRVDVRYSATRRRGRARLLTGMVRTNRPWRLVFGLTSALAAAVATSAFGFSSSTIWQIADRIDTWRQVIGGAGSVALLVGWLIAAHHLWERRGRGAVADRELTLLYNVSTVLTLTLGVGCTYLGLFAVNVGAVAFLIPSSLLTSILGHPTGWPTYLAVAWAFTTMGVVAGALGSSLESDAAVRQAAYGYRERQRRARIQREEEGS